MNKPLLIVLILLMSATAAQACIWDRDTLAMERAKFPEVNELIVGYFPRHSTAYYQWRKEQVLAIPVGQRTAADYDDLGASYDKLGEHDKAIQTILDKMQRFPDEGVYESHANLGTFYIHNGELKKGAEFIGKAIEINSDAHFGREVYQKLLVEYVLQQREAGNTLPLENEWVGPYFHIGPDSTGFASFIIEQQGLNPEDHESQLEEVDRATKGVLGIMRFGNFDSPILLEVLGDLLRQQGRSANVQRLAARAYLKASYEVDDLEAIERYRKKAADALHSQEGVSLSLVEDNLKAEIAEGDIFFAKIVSDETAWAQAGEDLDVVFANAYYNDAPELRQSFPRAIVTHIRSMTLLGAALFGLVTIIIVSVVVSVLRFRRRRREPLESAA